MSVHVIYHAVGRSCNMTLQMAHPNLPNPSPPLPSFPPFLRLASSATSPLNTPVFSLASMTCYTIEGVNSG